MANPVRSSLVGSFNPWLVHRRHRAKPRRFQGLFREPRGGCGGRDLVNLFPKWWVNDGIILDPILRALFFRTQNVFESDFPNSGAQKSQSWSSIFFWSLFWQLFWRHINRRSMGHPAGNQVGPLQQLRPTWLSLRMRWQETLGTRFCTVAVATWTRCRWSGWCPVIGAKWWSPK